MQFLTSDQFRTNFDITAEWGEGFTLKLDLTNLTENLSDGIVEFESEFEIIPGQIWGAEVISREGNTYTLRLDEDRDTIDSQETSSVFFNANKVNDEIILPLNIKLGSENILIDNAAELEPTTDRTESAIDTVTPDTPVPIIQNVALDIAADIDFSLVRDWGSGFQGSISITNPTEGNIDTWSLEFDLPSEIDNIWDAEIDRHQNGSYVITSNDWNREIRAGETLTFGFTANGSANIEPENFELEGYIFNSPSTSDSIYSSSNPDLTPELQLKQPYQGRATFYDAANPVGGLGNSGFDVPTQDQLHKIVAINNVQWNGSAASGAFMQVSGPKQREGAAPIIVQVTDKLVERADGMDMSAEAFAKVANPVDGIVNIDYQLVGPSDDYVTAYGHRIGDGIIVEGIADSKPYYPVLRLNNHRYPVESVELIENDGDLVEFERGSDNRFVLDEISPIYGAQDLLVTDIFGQQVTLNDINISNGSDADVVTGQQFALI